MARNPPTIWPLEPHTEAKHIILRRYLQAWLPIMSRWNGRILYIDGFAGPGSYSGGEDGSPIIALQEAIGHTAQLAAEIVFLFIEVDPKRHAVLEERVNALTRPPNLKVQCICGMFDETLTQVLNYVEDQQKHLAPTFAFLDPFGFSHTPLSLVRRLMQHPRCEILITFMYEEVNRFLSHPQQPANYDALFGCSEWRDALSMTDPKWRKEYLHNLYMRQLQHNAGIEFVRSFEMVNRGNRTDYFLFFGTKSLEGLKKMKEAMWKVDESSGLQFLDATDVSQMLLFKREPDYGDLKARIVGRFKGQTVEVGEVEQFVLVDTPYRETHYKRQILRPMELSNPPELVVRLRTGHGRKGAFPPGTVIEFV